MKKNWYCADCGLWYQLCECHGVPLSASQQDDPLVMCERDLITGNSMLTLNIIFTALDDSDLMKREVATVLEKYVHLIKSVGVGNEPIEVLKTKDAFLVATAVHGLPNALARAAGP